MELVEKIKRIAGEKKSAAAITVLGVAGLLLIMISSFLPENKKEKSPVDTAPEYSAGSYCRETEEKLEDFLKKIDGAGEVDVYITVGTGVQYVYAAEEKRSVSENKTEEEEKYVMVGGNSREPLLEKIEAPEITGAVIVSTGCGSPAVEERIYRAASAALGIPTYKIYVTKAYYELT